MNVIAFSFNLHENTRKNYYYYYYFTISILRLKNIGKEETCANSPQMACKSKAKFA